jgi:hypothetical protein
MLRQHRVTDELVVLYVYMVDRPDFPTIEQVRKATRPQLARWYRFLPSGDTAEQQKVIELIRKRFKELGGMTPALSKKIGI